MRFVLASTALALALGSFPAGALDAYDQALTLQGVTFRVQCDNAVSLNTLTLTPSGLEIDNSAITVEVDGVVITAASHNAHQRCDARENDPLRFLQTVTLDLLAHCDD